MHATQAETALPHPSVDRVSPLARRGLAGLWDRFVAPGAARSENLLQAVALVTAGIAAGTYPLAAQLPAESPPFPTTGAQHDA